MKYEHLFTPIKINQLMIKNRIVAAPISDTYEEKALGGAGIVIAGHAIVEPGRSSFASPMEPDAFSKYQVEETRKRVLKIHAGGARASIELFHGGREARVRDYAKGPVGYQREDGVEVRAMDKAMREETLNCYAQCAKNAKEIGFDMIFLHFGHGWLPAQFLSPYFNSRKDDYGGSIENRARFPLEILKTVRQAVGKDYPIDMRISAYEWVEGSISFEDVLIFIKMAEPYIDTVQISAGLDMNREANVHMATTNFEEHMPNVKWAREVKKQVSIPVSVVGAVLSPKEGEELIKSQAVDLVAFGRSFLADPFWPKKAMEGREEDIVPCLRCLQCYHISTNRRNVGCSVNPRFHNEDFIPRQIPLCVERKRVVIIGGGPAGMQAAITSTLRGHEVLLFEKEAELGGQLCVIEKEVYKKDIQRYLTYLRTQIKKLAIPVFLGKAITPEEIRALKPDCLLIAIGAKETTPPIQGIQLPHVLHACEAIRKEEILKEEIVMIGGGTIGSELALELALMKKKKVTLIEMGRELAPQANSLYKIALHQKLKETDKLTIYLQSTCKEIKENEVVVLDRDGNVRHLKASQVIIATGLKAKREEAYQFYGITPETIMIGDCNAPRIIMDAVFEGHSAALHL